MVAMNIMTTCEIRNSCIDILHKKVLEEVPISREEYEFALLGWELEPIVMDGAQIAILLRCEHEVHIHLEKIYAFKYGRRLIIKYFKRDLGLLKYLTTTSKKDRHDGRFLERLGFYKTNEDDKFFYYRADQSNF